MADEDEDALPRQERPHGSAVEHSGQKAPAKVCRKGKYNHIKCATTEALSEPAINKDDDVEADEEVMPWHMGLEAGQRTYTAVQIFMVRMSLHVLYC